MSETNSVWGRGRKRHMPSGEKGVRLDKALLNKGRGSGRQSSKDYYGRERGTFTKSIRDRVSLRTGRGETGKDARLYLESVEH